jgi:predicted Zn-dependent protease
MAQEQAKQLLQQGIAASQGGRPDMARDLLRQAIQMDPGNETAWLWLSSVAQDTKERVFCLRQVLKINPQNEHALKGLQALGGGPSPEGPATPAVSHAPGVPELSEEKYARIQQAVDDFLRHYNPQPADQLNIQWARKEKRRYGEQGARRLRQMTYAAAALTVIALAAGVIVILSALGILTSSGLDTGSQRIQLPSVTPTQTLTPTPGGATPTPLPQAVAAILTNTPAGIQAGVQRGGFDNAPTPVYPQLDVNVRGPINGAINLYSIGQYSLAIGTLEVQHDQSGAHCYSAVVYYEAMSYADRGSRADLEKAAQSLEDALEYQPPQGYRSCQDDPLLYVGLGHVNYLQGNLDTAYSWSVRALEADPRLVQASVTKARVELARGEIPAAWNTINDARLRAPGDVNLLVMATEIELAGGQANSALDYARQALYVDPVSQPALQLQAQAALLLAEQIPADEQESKIQHYGLAVISAQTLLLYYSGDPLGYLYLAQARIGEGNDDFAETALTRIIQAGDDFPERDASIVLDAYRERGNLYYRQGRLQEAQADFELMTQTSGTIDAGVSIRLIDIALKLGDYAKAKFQLDEALSVEPENRVIRLLQAKALVEICTFHPDKLACEYDDMLNMLDNDEFIMGLESEPQRADAYSYRAQARYHTALDSRALSDAERELAFQLALSDLNQALSTRQSPVDHYYRGLLLDATGQLADALEEYQWVTYWNTVYPYPFVDTKLANRVETVADRLVEMATEEPEDGEGQPEEEETAEPPEAVGTPGPTRTPSATRTPVPVPSAPRLP